MSISVFLLSTGFVVHKIGLKLSKKAKTKSNTVERSAGIYTVAYS